MKRLGPDTRFDRDDERLEAYLDGMLMPSERQAFERELRDQPDLRRLVEQQRAIDSGIRRQLSPPQAAELRLALQRALQRCAPDGDAAPARAFATPSRTPFRLSRPLALAAMLFIVLGGGWLAWTFLSSRTSEDPYKRPWRSFEVAYHHQVEQGLKPDWICETNRELGDWFWNQYRTRLHMSPLPSNIRTVGLCTTNTITPLTTMILAEADGQPVVVFVDVAEFDHSDTFEQVKGLKLHRRTLGPLVMYELSPFDSPRLLDAIYDAGAVPAAAPAPGPGA